MARPIKDGTIELRCCTCGEVKLVAAFYKADKSHCRACLRGIQNKRYLENREARDKAKTYGQQRRLLDPIGVARTARDSELRTKYGITLVEYEALFLAQGGVCAICRNPETVKRGDTLRVLSVDGEHLPHGHGPVRGLLCGACNMGLGKFKDNANLLLRAAAYLAGSERIFS